MARKLRVVKAAARAETGSGAARRIRAAGQVPAVIYGRGRESRALSLVRGDMERVVNHGERLVQLEIDGRQSQAMVKEVQYEPVTRAISHVDFQEISATETITVSVALRARGTPVGAKDGGVLAVVHREVEVEALPSDVPEEIRLDVSALAIGESIRAGEIELPKGITLITPPNQVVIAVEHPRGEEDAETQVAAAEGAAEPEVLTGKKEEAEEPVPEARPAPAAEKKPEAPPAG
jgi:large subunit ribosomal protein L25